MYKSTWLYIYIYNLAGNLGAMYEGAVRLKILVQAQQREALWGQWQVDDFVASPFGHLRSNVYWCHMECKARSYVDTSWYMSVYHSVYRGKIRHVWCIVGGSCWVQQVAVLAISAAAFLTTLGISVQFCIHPSKRQGKLSAHPGDYCVFVRSCSWKCIQLAWPLGK